MITEGLEGLKLMVLLTGELLLVLALAEWLDLVDHLSHAPSDVNELAKSELAIRIKSRTWSRPHFTVGLFSEDSAVEVHGKSVMLLIFFGRLLWDESGVKKFAEHILAECLVAIGLEYHIVPS